MATKTMSWTLVWDVEAAAPSATPSAGDKMCTLALGARCNHDDSRCFIGTNTVIIMSRSFSDCRTNESQSGVCTCGVDDQTQCGGDLGGGDSGCFWIWTNKNKKGIYATNFFTQTQN